MEILCYYRFHKTKPQRHLRGCAGESHLLTLYQHKKKNLSGESEKVPPLKNIFRSDCFCLRVILVEIRQRFFFFFSKFQENEKKSSSLESRLLGLWIIIPTYCKITCFIINHLLKQLKISLL